MLAAERRAVIMDRARGAGSVRIADLVDALRVSDVTIRRDLEVLVEGGLLVKVHGGAVFRGEGKGSALVGLPPGLSSAMPGHRPVEQRAPAIGVMVPKSSYYFNRVIDGIRSALPGEDSRLLLAVSDYEPHRERELVAGLIDSGAEALVLAPSDLGGDGGDEPWVCGLGVPTVLVERRLHGPAAAGVSWVRTAHESGAAAAVRHLHALGHPRIALLTRGDTPTAQSVRQGWEGALRELCGPGDLPPAISGQDIPGWPRWSPAQVTSLVDQLRAGGATALLCHSDEDALALLQNGLSRQLRVPQELSVIAYDDEFAAFASPALTAVSPHKQDVGALALRTLLDLCARPDAPALHIDVEPSLTHRDSTAPAHSPRPSAGH